jgi:hypothetical protein
MLGHEGFLQRLKQREDNADAELMTPLFSADDHQVRPPEDDRTLVHVTGHQ